MSQHPNTKDYIIVSHDTNVYEKWCKQYSNNSGNEKINNLIQKMQLKIDSYNDTVFEWIPYNQFIDIEKVGEDGLYLATWEDGPLDYDHSRNKYIRNQNKKVSLGCLCNSQNITNEFLDINIIIYKV